MRTIPIELYDENDCEYSFDAPAIRVVCPRCNGEGRHINPGVDEGGLSREDLQDPDFMEDYLGGVYDVTCSHCKGLRVSDELDWDAFERDHPEECAGHRQNLACLAEMRAEMAAERRMGC